MDKKYTLFMDKKNDLNSKEDEALRKAQLKRALEEEKKLKEIMKKLKKKDGE